MKQKRFQYWSRDGIKWTKWFNCDDIEEKIQAKGRVTLLNEYRNV